MASSLAAPNRYNLQLNRQDCRSQFNQHLHLPLQIALPVACRLRCGWRYTMARAGLSSLTPPKSQSAIIPAIIRGVLA